MTANLAISTSRHRFLRAMRTHAVTSLGGGRSGTLTECAAAGDESRNHVCLHDDHSVVHALSQPAHIVSARETEPRSSHKEAL
jgi:hypothetical protein